MFMSQTFQIVTNATVQLIQNATLSFDQELDGTCELHPFFAVTALATHKLPGTLHGGV